MNMRRVLLLAAVTAASAGAAERAEAQAGYGCAGGYGYGYGLGAWDVGRLYGVLAQNVPHFAAFPPVYYSLPVPRTYGYSPFAYPPGVMTPEVVVAEPLAVENPYFSETSGTAATSSDDFWKKLRGLNLNQPATILPGTVSIRVLNSRTEPL